jgi:OOP family OmpA-OmpF porin
MVKQDYSNAQNTQAIRVRAVDLVSPTRDAYSLHQGEKHQLFSRTKIMTKLGFTLASILIFMSGNALAEESKELGVYIAGAGGWTKWDDDNSITDDWCCMDDTDLTYQVSAGYKFNRYFALDARYTGLGKYDVGNERIDFAAWSVNGVGILPISNNGWELFGQLGLGQIDGDSRHIGHDKETMWTIGGGVRYSLNRHLSLSSQLDAYSFDTNKWGDGGSKRNYIGAFTLGIQYIFE